MIMKKAFSTKRIADLRITNFYLFLLFLLFIFFSCVKKKELFSYPSVPGYDFTNPVIIQLKANLDEISGITYYPKDSSIFAINDENGILYKISMRKQVQVKRWKFSGEGDYEDIVLHDSTFYALRSDGNIKSFTFLSKNSLKSDEIVIPLPGNNEFETLYYDPHLKKIITLCKDCETDAGKITSAYALDPNLHTFSETPVFTINADDVGEEIGIDKLKIQPSCAAVHPITKDVYIISSKNKILLITDHYGKLRDVYELDPILFKQPEGITFTPAGDLLISNEAADIGAPNILIFHYKRLPHKKG